ncbi:MAG: histidinol-phosphatase [Candidatus Izemoplasma sp.]
MKTNYHTHHYLCRHASGTTEDYVKEALKHGLLELGMSDHAPSDIVYDMNVRMKKDEYQDYLADIDYNIAKYSDKIKILKGVEVEYFEHNDDYYLDLRKDLDYMVLGQHYIYFNNNLNNLISSFALVSKEEIISYANIIDKALESNHFDILAHPDLYMCGYRDWDDHAIEAAHIICKSAKKNNMIIEYNVNGLRKNLVDTPQGKKPPYPRNEFWEIAKTYDLKVMINSDSHEPEHLNDDYVKIAEEAVQKIGLNIIEFLPIK